jgi:hypothetical protein
MFGFGTRDDDVDGWRRIAPAEVLEASVAGNLPARWCWSRSDAIEQEFDRLAHSMMLRWARVAELDRHRADQGRLARSGRAETIIMPRSSGSGDFRLDILLVERLRQIANRANDDIGA